MNGPNQASQMMKSSITSGRSNQNSKIQKTDDFGFDKNFLELGEANSDNDTFETETDQFVEWNKIDLNKLSQIDFESQQQNENKNPPKIVNADLLFGDMTQNFANTTSNNFEMKQSVNNNKGEFNWNDPDVSVINPEMSMMSNFNQGKKQMIEKDGFLDF